MTLVWLSNLIATVSPLFCCRAICCAEVFTPRTIPATWVPPPPPSTPPRISPSVPACAHALSANSAAAAAAVRVICRIDDISHLLLDSDESAIPVPATDRRAGSTPNHPYDGTRPHPSSLETRLLGGRRPARRAQEDPTRESVRGRAGVRARTRRGRGLAGTSR